MPYGRSYQVLIGQTPGLVYNTDGNPNSHGALRSQQPLHVRRREHDGPDGGDGRQQPQLRSDPGSARPHVGGLRGIRPRHGRDRGRHHEVRHEPPRRDRSSTWCPNDQWNAPNTTQSEVAGADGTYPSLARTQFDRINPTYSGTSAARSRGTALWFFCRLRTRGGDVARAADECGAGLHAARTTSRRRSRRS